MKTFIIVLFFLTISLSVFPQISQKGSPVGVSQSEQLKNKLVFYEMPKIDLQQLQKEDVFNDKSNDIPWRFGQNINVKYNTTNSGVWDVLSNGDKLWRLGIYSPGALTINLIFDNFKLPPGAKMFVYNIDKTDIIGAFTDFNNQKDNSFATTLVKGDKIIIEYYEPVNSLFLGSINLSQVTHGYRGVSDFTKAFSDSWPCHNNVNCPEAVGWENQIRSVCMLVVNGNGFCSGSLISNTSQDKSPYVLTANHCASSNPTTWIYWFNWQSPTCSNPTSTPSYNSVTNSTLKARNEASDFLLTQINDALPANFNVYYAGWNRQDIAATSCVGIHHPKGDIKKISYSSNSLFSTSWNGKDPQNSHWEYLWTDGKTQPGSSGGPIFDQNHRIIGQHHGSDSAANCNFLNQFAWCGKLSMSWSFGSTSATRLSDWLDGTNTGEVFINGYDPNCIIPQISTVVCANSANITWNSVSGAVGYTLRYRQVNGAWIYLPQFSTNSYSLTGLIYNTSYQVQVNSIYSSGSNSAYSNLINFTTPSSAICSSNYSAYNSVTSNMIQAYNAGGGCSIGYILRYRPNKAAQPLWSYLPQQSSNTFNIPGLMGDEAYKIEIQNVCSYGSSSWVATSSLVSTSLESSLYVPTGLTVSHIGTASAALSWLSNSKMNWSNGYFVEYKKVSDLNWISSSGTSGTSWYIYGLSANTKYHVRIKVPRSGGTDYTEPVSFTTTTNQDCGQLNNLSISNVTASSAFISWSNLSNYSGYYVAYKQENGYWDLAGVPGSNSLTLASLQPGKKYYVAVKGYCSNGFSNWSFSSFTTLLGKSSSSVSNSISSNEIENSYLSMSIYPNPNEGAFTINCETSKEGTYNLRINSSLGTEIKSENVQLIEGANKLEYYLNQLSSGTYFITIEGQGLKKSEKLVIK